MGGVEVAKGLSGVSWVRSSRRLAVVLLLEERAFSAIRTMTASASSSSLTSRALRAGQKGQEARPACHQRNPVLRTALTPHQPGTGLDFLGASPVDARSRSWFLTSWRPPEQYERSCDRSRRMNLVRAVTNPRRSSCRGWAAGSAGPESGEVWCSTIRARSESLCRPESRGS